MIASGRRAANATCGRTATAARALGLAAVAVLVPACSGAFDSSSDRVISELERFAFVPPGAGEIAARDGRNVTYGSDRALLVDRFEATRGRWREYVEATGIRPDPRFEEVAGEWSAGTDARPATGMTLDEARAFASWRGMRLLTAAEWLRVALGTRAATWPWGTSADPSAANTLDLGLGRAVDVGTFEHGRTPFGTYDMKGNVWEWVEGAAHVPRGSDETAVALAWAMGGSFVSHARPLYAHDEQSILVIDHLDLDPRSRARDVGLRCAVDAAQYLEAHAHELGSDARTRARIAAVGRRWGRDAAAWIEQLAGKPRAAPALRWLADGARG